MSKELAEFKNEKEMELSFFTHLSVAMAPSVPTSEQVTAYLAAHKLEPVIEDAVNDAVLKQVKHPFRHIAEVLLKKSEELGETKPATRVSIGDNTKKAGFASETTVVDAHSGAYAGSASAGDELNREYVKGSGELSADLEQMLKTFFDKMDDDSNGEVSYDEAVKFWGKNFAKVNAKSMFNEVDEDGNQNISWAEFLAFWKNVVASGYSTDDLKEEVEMMLEGGSWVDFNDGRTT